MKIQLYCRCGAGAEGEIGSLEAAEKFRAIWYKEHEGPGHGDCEKDEAVKVFVAKYVDLPQ